MPEEECLQKYIDYLKKGFQGSISKLPDGSFETDKFSCGRRECHVTCILRGKIEYGKVAHVVADFSGEDHCPLRS